MFGFSALRRCAPDAMLTSHNLTTLRGADVPREYATGYAPAMRTRCKCLLGTTTRASRYSGHRETQGSGFRTRPYLSQRLRPNVFSFKTPAEAVKEGTKTVAATSRNSTTQDPDAMMSPNGEFVRMTGCGPRSRLTTHD